jgi:hypothetical protein
MAGNGRWPLTAAAIPRRRGRRRVVRDRDPPLFSGIAAVGRSPEPGRLALPALAAEAEKRAWADHFYGLVR